MFIYMDSKCVKVPSFPLYVAIVCVVRLLLIDTIDYFDRSQSKVLWVWNTRYCPLADLKSFKVIVSFGFA